ncbi:hypothetical protein AZA_31036 [Nitrospirillum viridazoti Y2]|uniref:Uncharacterized protein n=1 Tax=Nitrospirillum amazonense TaxID=28077 RepID=A0A560I2R0_9PROT|nr:hypothetical protein [Nitrospirillum amazonense]EGY00015.1 hypothetical protein AZA_31036 [Nitrospirillum amazonense Y2]TWB52825.1 hypothetical protein FBZ92_11771 [Nitrospirillum amazonense]
MSQDAELRTIACDDQTGIVAALRNRESFEVGGCHERMADAVLFLERQIGALGLTSRVYTKGRLASLALLPGVAAVGLAAHNLATLNPDYEIMKRPIDQALRVTFVKNDPDLSDHVEDMAQSVGRGLSGAANWLWGAARSAGEEIAAATEKAVAQVSSTATAAVEMVDEHIPSKEMIVGAATLGIAAPILDRSEIAAVGAKVIAAGSSAASAVTEVASKAATIVKENPLAAAGGAVVGVGAVAAAPFTGGGSVLAGATLIQALAGAGGLAAAVGLAGAGAGVTASHLTSQEGKDAAFRSGMEKGTAEAAVKIEELSRVVARAVQKLAERRQLDDFMGGLAAVGFAMAACDGPVTDEEREIIEEFVCGVSKLALPPDLRQRFQAMAASPPTADVALTHITSFGQEIWGAVDGLLEVLSAVDGPLNDEQQRFRAQWNGYKAVLLTGGRA